MNTKFRAVHMVGIGGAGMSGIAEVLLNLGHAVQGSDIAEGQAVKRLKSLGAEIFIGHSASNVKNPQVLVRSTAVSDDNPELIAAREKGIPIIGRAEMLAELMRLHTGIAIAGTHGKTTTTSLCASIFDTAGLDPTVIIGGLLNAYGANAYLGKGEYLIAEADESDGSFLCLLPILNVVTNVDYDHVDHYSDQDSVDKHFIEFMNKVPFYGVNIVCGDDPGVQRILPQIKRPVITYGFGKDNHIRAEIQESTSINWFRVFIKDENGEEIEFAEIELNHPGKHNVLNALAAIGVSIEAGIEPKYCVAGLANFSGVSRRFERKGEVNGITIIDDYGHHPVEIKATLACAQQVFPQRRIIMAFQPHRFTRTQALFGDFCQAFEGVDMLFLSEIYPASEKPIPGISGASLAQGIRQVSQINVEFIEQIKNMDEIIAKELKAGDVLITQGAGNITTVGPKVLSRLEALND